MNSEARTAIVTGGARGIGEAIARRLAGDGHAVAVFDIDGAGAEATAKSIVAAGGRAIGLAVDVTAAQLVEDAVAQVTAQLGSPTILVNNAGVIRDNLLFKLTEADWTTVLDVHLRGAFLLTKAVQKHMVEARWGRVISLSSISALGNRGQANYAAAKAGIQGFTKTVAIELGRYGVTANAIGPGFIETDMTRATAERVGMPFKEFIAAAARDIPVGRVGQPEDIANLAAFLASDQAGFVSGQVIYAAGGPTD